MHKRLDAPPINVGMAHRVQGRLPCLVYIQYVNNSFIVGAFWNLSESGPRLTDEELGYPFYGNRLVGVPRLRQLRVVDGPCVLPIEALGSSCFGRYTPQTESRATYGNVPGYCTRVTK